MRLKVAYVIILAVQLLLCTVSCTEKTKQLVPKSFINNNKSAEKLLEGDSVRRLENLKSFKTQKLGDRKFVIKPNDTIEFQEPMLKLFTGQIYGRNVQLWLSIGHYAANRGTLYREGKAITSSYLHKEDNQYVLNILGNESYGNNKLDGFTINFKPEDDYATVLIYDRKHILKENKSLFFKPLNKFKYFNVICPEYLSLFGKTEYIFDFALDLNHSVKDSILNLANILSPETTALKRNEYNIRSEVVEFDESYEGDECYRGGLYEYNFPVYLDSMIFVYGNLVETDHGGAHGSLATSYINYDMQSGKQITFEDLLDSDNEQYLKYLSSAVLEQHYEGREEMFDEDLITFPPQFYIQPEGIQLIYPIYWFGGGFWEKEVFLPYKDIKPFLKTHKYFRHQNTSS